MPSSFCYANSHAVMYRTKFGRHLDSIITWRMTRGGTLVCSQGELDLHLVRGLSTFGRNWSNF